MISISLVGANDDRIAIDPLGDDYQALSEARGFGISPTSLTFLEGAGDGSVFRFSRRGARDIDLPIGIVGATRGEVEDRQSRLASALRFAPEEHAHAPRLEFTRDDGSVFGLEVHYVAGAETQYESAYTDTYCRWLLTLRCPDPYWTAVDELSFTLKAAGAARSLLPRLAKLQVSSSQVLGSVTVDNPGTVRTPLLWEVRGPGTSFTATAPGGQSFTLNASLSAGDVRFVDTASASVTDAAGVNRYTELGTAPKLFSLPPGRSSLSVLMTGATSESQVIGRYRPKRELVF